MANSIKEQQDILEKSYTQNLTIILTYTNTSPHKKTDII